MVLPKPTNRSTPDAQVWEEGKRRESEAPSLVLIISVQFVGSGNEGAAEGGDKGHLVSIFIITHQWWPRNGANPSHTCAHPSIHHDDDPSLRLASFLTCAHPSIHHGDDPSLSLAYFLTCAHPSMASCTERERQLMRLMVVLQP